jgi:hypothetical protein
VASFDCGAISRITIRAIASDRSREGREASTALQADLPERPQDGSHVPMRETANDFPRTLVRRRLSGQSPPNGVDQVGRQVGEIAEGLVPDLASLAKGPSQQMADVDLAVVGSCSGGYVHGAVCAVWHALFVNHIADAVNHQLRLLAATNCSRKPGSQTS